MTADQWRICCDPDLMLIAIRSVATDQQLRLWCCACVRRVWDILENAEAGRRAVAVAEEFARGAANPADLKQAYQDAQDAMRGVRDHHVRDALLSASWCAADAVDALGVARSVGWGTTYAAVGQEDAAQITVERAAQAKLLREMLPASQVYRNNES